MIKQRNFTAKHAQRAGAGRHLNKKKRTTSRNPKHKHQNLV